MYKKKITIALPAHVRQIIGRLEAAGFEAYAVGGCVRDAVLGRVPNDWDITTSALPEDVKGLFSHTIDTGLKHGTVTVLAPHSQAEEAADARAAEGRSGRKWDAYEVTTFRIDGEYEDARHPKDVTFTRSLKEDLLRRDFTINAMAYNDSRGLVDCFGGLADLQAGRIRCVGDAKARFTEDALRMMRAVRFAAQLGFSIEEDTLAQIGILKNRLSMISVERIQTELVKLLVSPHPEMIRLLYECGLTDVFLPEFSALIDTPQNNRHHGETVGDHTINAICKVPADKVLRLTMLFHDIAKPRCRTTDADGQDHFYGHPRMSADMAGKIMRRLRFDNDTTSRVAALVRLHDERIVPVEAFLPGQGLLPEKKAQTVRIVRRAISRNGKDVYPDLFAVMRADVMAQSTWMRAEKLERIDIYESIWRQIMAEGQCLSIRDLAVTGKDLIQAGIAPGPQLGGLLSAMLEHVLDHPDHNSREYLLPHFVGK